MTTMDYWQECLANAAEEIGLTLTAEQLEHLAGAAKSGHENYGMAFYQPSSSDHYQPQIDRLRRELADEKAKEPCPQCFGRGRLFSQGPYHSSNSQCWKCNGEGKVKP